jgi:hypothetical protein
VLEVVEGTEARSKIVQREATSEIGEHVCKTSCAIDVGDGGSLGNFKNQVPRIDLARSQLVSDHPEEVSVAYGQS